MNITKIEIQSEAQPGRTIVLERDPESAGVMIGWRDADGGSEGPIEFYDAADDDKRKFDVADTLAGEIFGRTSGGMASATSIMIYDAWHLLKQVAGE